MDIFYKTLSKRFKTKKTGIYYKQIEKTVIDDSGNTKVTILKDDKVYCIQYKDIDDKWKFKTIGKYSDGIREVFCHNKRIEIMNQTMLGEQPKIIKKKEKKNIITLEQIYDIYMKQKRLENRLGRKVGQIYRVYIKDIFGQKDIDTITTEKIIEFKEFLITKKLSHSTINGNIAFLGTLFNVAIDGKFYAKTNPIKDKRLKPTKLDNARDRYLTKKEIDELLKAVNGDDEVELFTKLSLTTGGRLETILNIKKKDINLDNGTVILKDIKNDKTYSGFLTKELVSILKNITKDLEPNSYIVGLELKKFSFRITQRHLKKILDELFNKGLAIRDAKNRVVVHTLRHTFASHLAINEVPIFTIQKLMNHSDIKMTMRYAKLAPDSGKNAIEELYR